MGRYADVDDILGEETLVPVTWRTASTGALPPPPPPRFCRVRSSPAFSRSSIGCTVSGVVGGGGKGGAAGLGRALDPGADADDIASGTRQDLPLWLVRNIANRNMVELQ